MSVVERTAKATRLLARTINWTHREFVTQDYHFFTLIKQYSVSHIGSTQVHLIGKCFITSLMIFYSRKEYPTRDSVSEKVKNECVVFTGERLCLC